MYKSQPKSKKAKVSTEPKRKPPNQNQAPSNPQVRKESAKAPSSAKNEDAEVPATIPAKVKAFVPGKFVTKHLVKSPFKFTTTAIPDEVSAPLFLEFFQNLSASLDASESPQKRVSPTDLVIGLGKILRILQRHVASPTEFPLPLRLVLVCDKDPAAATLLYPLTQLISMLEKPGVFGALPISEGDASKLAAFLGMPGVLVVGIKAEATCFDPFVQAYVESAETKFVSSEAKPWPTGIRSVNYLPLETKQVTIPVPVPKARLPKS